MFDQIKNGKLSSLIFIIAILAILIFKIKFPYSIIILIGTIVVLFIYFLYKVLLSKNYDNKDFITIKKLRNTKFSYKNYKDVYDYVDYTVKISTYKDRINAICDNLLVIKKSINMNAISNGLDELKKNIKNNEIRKKHYELCVEVDKIIKKYYDKNGKRLDEITISKTSIIYLISLLLVHVLFTVYAVISKNINYYEVAEVLLFIVIMASSVFIKKP